MHLHLFSWIDLVDKQIEKRDLERKKKENYHLDELGIREKGRMCTRVLDYVFFN